MHVVVVSGSVYARILSTLLNEMDGIDGAGAAGVGVGAGSGADADAGVDGAVVVMAATNMRSSLDDALLRPGRFDQHLYLGYPTEADRAAILRMCMRGMPTSASAPAPTPTPMATPTAASSGDGPDMDLAAELAEDEHTGGLTCAALRHVCREAAMEALRQDIEAKQVARRHFVQAISAQRPKKGPS